MNKEGQEEPYRVTMSVKYVPFLSVQILLQSQPLSSGQIRRNSAQFQWKSQEKEAEKGLFLPIWPISAPIDAICLEKEGTVPVHVSTPSLGEAEIGGKCGSEAFLVGETEITDNLLGTGHFHPVDSDISQKKGINSPKKPDSKALNPLSPPFSLFPSTQIPVLQGKSAQFQPFLVNSEQKKLFSPQICKPSVPKIAEIEATLRALTEGIRILPTKPANSIFSSTKKLKNCKYFPQSSKMRLKSSFSTKKCNFKQEIRPFPPSISPSEGNIRPRSRSSAARLAILSRTEGKYRVLDYTSMRKDAVSRAEKQGKDWSESQLDREVQKGLGDFNWQRSGQLVSVLEVAGALRLLHDGREVPSNMPIRCLQTLKKLHLDLLLPFEPAAWTIAADALLAGCVKMMKIREITVEILRFRHEREALLAICAETRAELVSKQLSKALKEWKVLYPGETQFIYKGQALLPES